jgi:hypothetical protein
MQPRPDLAMKNYLTHAGRDEYNYEGRNSMMVHCEFLTLSTDSTKTNLSQKENMREFSL